MRMRQKVLIEKVQCEKSRKVLNIKRRGICDQQVKHLKDPLKKNNNITRMECESKARSSTQILLFNVGKTNKFRVESSPESFLIGSSQSLFPILILSPLSPTAKFTDGQQLQNVREGIEGSVTPTVLQSILTCSAHKITIR